MSCDRALVSSRAAVAAGAVGHHSIRQMLLPLAVAGLHWCCCSLDEIGSRVHLAEAPSPGGGCPPVVLLQPPVR